MAIRTRNFEYNANQQTLIGTKLRRLYDEETGEVIEVEQITKRIYGQKQFWKVYLIDFLKVLGIIESKQLDAFIYILENTEQSNNTFIGSQRDIATACNISLQTVNRILQKLQDAGFITMIKRSVYQISANVMMKGSETKKQILLNYYKET